VSMARHPDHARRDHLLLHFGGHAKLRAGSEVPVINRADGVYVRDTAGRRYLDAFSCLKRRRLSSRAWRSTPTGTLPTR
jgi:adenosylmethionine-8-amino-7-oxononanoate aminotransferase